MPPRSGRHRLRLLGSFLLVPALSVASPGKPTAETIRVGPDERVFLTLCAAQAGGYRLRKKVPEIEALPAETVAAIRAYVQGHGYAEEDYVKYALLLGQPPALEKRYATTDPLPPIRLGLPGFAEALERFYQEGELRRIWDRHLPEHEKEARRLRKRAVKVLDPVFQFVREPAAGGSLRVVVIPNLLQRPGSGYGVLLDGVAYLVVGKGVKDATLQHEFLHTVVNPLTRSHIAAVYRAKALHPLARARAPFYYRSWKTLVNETLVRTIVVMLRHRSPGKRRKEAEKLAREGYVLAPYFLEKLESYEANDTDFATFFPRLFDPQDLGEAVARILEASRPRFEEPGRPKGPLNDAVSRRYRVVRLYGTRGSRREAEEMRKMIEGMNAAYFNRLDVIKPDTALTEEEIRTSNLFLYGTVSSNAVLQRVAAELPVGLSAEAIQVGERRYTDRRTKIVFCCANPLNPKRYLVVYTGLSWETVLGVHLPFQGPTDYVVCLGLERVEEGFFRKGRLWDGPERQTILPRSGPWEVFETPHYRFHFRPGSVAGREIRFVAAVQEAGLRRIQETLGGGEVPTLSCFLYPTMEEKVEATGYPGSGIAEPALAEVHLVYGPDRRVTGPHEDTHVLAFHWWGGSRLPFLVEGVAVAVDGHWLGAPLEDWIRLFAARGTLLPVEGLLQPDLFVNQPDLLSYPVAGAFVGFLLREYGTEAVGRFHAEVRPGRIPEDFRRIFGEPLEAVVARWQQAMGAGKPRAYTGVVLAELPDGVFVTRVYDGSPAEAAGLEVGDRVEAIGGRQVLRLEDAQTLLARAVPGEGLAVEVARGERWVAVTLRPVDMESFLVSR
jgi:hypothetical protein